VRTEAFKEPSAVGGDAEEAILHPPGRTASSRWEMTSAARC